MPTKPSNPRDICRWCEHYSGRVTGDYGACFLHSIPMAPFDRACTEFRRDRYEREEAERAN